MANAAIGINDLQKPTPRVFAKDATAKARDRQRQAVYKLVEQRDGFVCRCCGRRVRKTLAEVLDRLEHHHVTPRSLGGRDEQTNLIVLCLGCHSDRHKTRTLAIWGNADKTIYFKRDGGKSWKSEAA